MKSLIRLPNMCFGNLFKLETNLSPYKQDYHRWQRATLWIMPGILPANWQEWGELETRFKTLQCGFTWIYVHPASEMAQPTIVRRLGGILFSLFFFFMLNVVLEWQDGLRSTDSSGFQVISFPLFFFWMFINMGFFRYMMLSVRKHQAVLGQMAWACYLSRSVTLGLMCNMQQEYFCVWLNTNQLCWSPTLIFSVICSGLASFWYVCISKLMSCEVLDLWSSTLWKMPIHQLECLDLIEVSINFLQ